MSDSKYGKRVLGEDAFAAQQAANLAAKAKGYVYGARVTGAPGGRKAAVSTSESPDGGTLDVAPPPPPPPPIPLSRPPAERDGAGATGDADQGGEAPPPPPPPPAVEPMSVEKLKAALEANTSIALHDQLLAAEFDRPEGEPRKGALRALLAAEQARSADEGGPRAAVIAEIQKSLPTVEG